jgi:hypothetical protein
VQGFFARGINAIHPQLSLRTQAHALYHRGTVAQECMTGMHSK